MIKFKVKEKINRIIYWTKINEDAENNIEFNLRLSEILHVSTRILTSMMQLYELPKWPSQQSRQTKGGSTTPRPTYSRQSNSATIYSPSCATLMKKTQGMLDYNSNKHKNVSLTSLAWQSHHGPHTKQKKFTT